MFMIHVNTLGIFINIDYGEYQGEEVFSFDILLYKYLPCWLSNCQSCRSVKRNKVEKILPSTQVRANLVLILAQAV